MEWVISLEYSNKEAFRILKYYMLDLFEALPSLNVLLHHFIRLLFSSCIAWSIKWQDYVLNNYVPLKSKVTSPTDFHHLTSKYYIYIMLKKRAKTFGFKLETDHLFQFEKYDLNNKFIIITVEHKRSHQLIASCSVRHDNCLFCNLDIVLI